MDRLRENVSNCAVRHLDTSTSQGRRKALLLALWFFMGLYIFTDSKGTNEQEVFFTIPDKEVPRGEFTLVDDDADDDSSFSETQDVANEDQESFGSDDDSYESNEEEDDSVDILNAQKTKLKVTGNKFLEFFNKYRSIKELNSHYSELMSTYESLNILSSEEITKTSTGRVITVYKLGKGLKDQSILVVGLEHAAEWPSMMSITYMVTRFVQLYGINEEITGFLDNMNLYIVPMLNPEGYAISRSAKKYRFFQHNKKRNGVDIGLDFGKFSQPETLGLKQWVKDKDDIVAFVNIQCCGEAVIIPSLPECFDETAKDNILKTGQSMVNTMKADKTGKYKFMQQTSARTKRSKLRKKRDNWSERYAVDWAASELNLKYSYMIEARGNKARKANVLDLVTADIVPVSREITKAILKLGDSIRQDDNPGVTGCESTVQESIIDDIEEQDDNDLFQTGFEDENQQEDTFDEDEEADNNSNGYEEEEEEETLTTKVGAEENVIKEKEAMDLYDSDSGEEDQDAIPDGDDSFEDDLDPSEEEGLMETEEEVSTENKNEESNTYTEDEAFDDRIEETNDLDSAVYASETEDEQPVDESPVANVAEPTFFYFAYNHDMLAEILTASGITSAKKLGVAKLEGYTMDFTYYSRKTWSSGIPDILKQKSGEVYGIVYEITESEHALLKQHNLDFSSSRQDPVMRWKKSRLSEVTVNVQLKATANVLKCITFKVRNKMPGKDIFKRIRRFSPSRQYKKCLLKALDTQQFPQDYVDRIGHFNTLLSDKGPLLRSKFRNPAIGHICDS